MRRNALELIAAGVAAMLLAAGLWVVDGLRRRVEFAAVSARIIDPERAAIAP